MCGSNLWNATGAWFSEQIAKREDWNEKGGTLERSQGLEQAKLGVGRLLEFLPSRDLYIRSSVSW